MSKILLFRLVMALLLCGAEPALAAKEDHGEWHLNVRFVNGSNAVSETAIASRVADWVAKAEQIYLRRPRLEIDYEVVRQTSKAGQDLASMVFDSQGAYASFMDQNFDNVAVTRTEGHLVVLITDRLCIGSYKGGAKKGNPSAGAATRTSRTGSTRSAASGASHWSRMPTTTRSPTSWGTCSG